MSFYLKYFPIAVILQLIFSELLTFNGYQANIMLLYVILCSMPLGNTSQSTLFGFLVGLFTDFVPDACAPTTDGRYVHRANHAAKWHYDVHRSQL